MQSAMKVIVRLGENGKPQALVAVALQDGTVAYTHIVHELDKPFKETLAEAIQRAEQYRTSGEMEKNVTKK